MSSLQQDFQKAVHNQIDIFVNKIRNFAAQRDMADAYANLPASIRNNRTLEQVILDDLLDGFVTIMADVPQSDIPVSIFHRLLSARESQAMQEYQARAILRKALTRKRADPSEIIPPEFIRLLVDIVPEEQMNEIGKDWIELTGRFGTLTLTDAVYSSVRQAGTLSDVAAEALPTLELNNVSKKAANDKNIKPSKTTSGPSTPPPPALLRGPSAQGDPLTRELRELLARTAKEVSAAELPVAHGRAGDVENISGVLLRKDAPYIALHGEEGVGKSTVVEAVVKLLAEGRGPGHLKNGRIFRVSMEELIFKDRNFTETLKELIKRSATHNRTHPNDPVILYIDDYGLSSSALSGSISTLRAHMNFEMKSSPGAMIIAEMTDQQMFVLEKADPESLKKFQKVSISELAASATADQLKIEAAKLARHHKLTISDDAIDHIIKKTTRYMPAHFHPAKDLAVLAAAAAQSELNGETTISDKSIDTSVAKMAKLPISLVGGESSDRIDTLEVELNKEIFGQEPAIKEVSDTIGLVNQGLQDPKKPIGVFYLTGPTGVGKTALVKALAKALFADEDALIRINLGDFQEKHTVSRITGAPPGYVGYGEKTALEDISEKPFSVVLVDEAEKGHPDVDNVLMNIMDEGELTLLNGKKLNFRNAVIVFTSNLGASAAEAIRDKHTIGFVSGNNDSDVKQISDEVAKARLKPEFRNRAAFLTLKSLSPEIVQKITLKEVDKVSKRLRDNKLYAGIKIDLTENALKELMSVGYDAKLGARPMQRAMQTYLQVPLGKWLRSNKDSLLNSEFTLVVNGLKNGLDLKIVYPVAPEQNNSQPDEPKVA
ncbi:MAG: ClpB protein [Micavibrio sp.]|nr:ClpB protein [Micavibrio sp.]